MFGTRYVGAIHGLLLTAWSMAGIFGQLTFAAGTAISLHTPILTSRNMIVVLPALYLIAAELSSALVKHWSKISGTIYLAAQAGLMSQPLAAYYTAEMAEQWRDSAAVVLRTPGCESGAIHVYGDARHYRFFTKSVRPDLRLIEIPQFCICCWGGPDARDCADRNSLPAAHQ
jgi:hypothetical protein